VRKSWHLRDPQLLDELRRDLRDQYPTLHVHEREGQVFVRGTFPIVSPTGRVLDRWAIEIELPAGYPEDLPIVRELENRIPWQRKFHVEDDGRACVLLPEERLLVFPEGATFVEYLRGPCLSFFLGQSLVASGEDWPFGEWAHGSDGVWQFYQELLDTTDKDELRRYLEALSKPMYRGHLPCPCGSAKKLRKCHGERVQAIRMQVPANAARQALLSLGLVPAPRRRR